MAVFLILFRCGHVLSQYSILVPDEEQCLHRLSQRHVDQGSPPWCSRGVLQHVLHDCVHGVPPL